MTARRWWGWPLVPFYAAGLAVKDWLRSTGKLKTSSLRWPIISVGSISAGGAGKTPVVIALAELLCAQGWHVDVLSRGYGRRESGVAQVIPDAVEAAHRFGDEPTLIAQKSNVPVWVGESRFAAGHAAETGSSAGEAPHGIHLLDDGFQHRQLARTLDIVLVTKEDLDDALLPAGNRREAFSALRRASLILLRAEEAAETEPRVRSRIGDFTPIHEIRRVLDFPKPLGVLSAGMRPMAFCAPCTAR